MKKYIYIFIYVLVLIFLSSHVVAVEINDTDLVNINNDYNSFNNSIIIDNFSNKHIFKSSNDNFKNSVNNNSVYFINSVNLTQYFDNGVLKEGFNNSILVFEGDFIDKGVISIMSDNVTVIGENSLLNNTVFCLDSNNIMITGLNFVLDKEFEDNEYAGILIFGDDCTVFNCTMKYTVPNTTTGFCIYSEGSPRNKINNFNLINCSFNFTGNNIGGGWDYGIFIDYNDNSIIYGNVIDTYLPLRSVNWGSRIFGNVGMDAVGSFVAQGCDNLTVSKNNISSHVTCGASSYPTLDTLLIYGCNDCIIEDNIIYSEDFDSQGGKDNYLQGIDLYQDNNILILNNQIHIRTSGGRPNSGTAYPIQVNGPAVNITIAFNNLTTFNFGPNVGIYSQGYYGYTSVNVISNFINVSGVAGDEMWGLVSGMELQDGNDLVFNNTIIVNNRGEYNDKLVSGISYIQKVDGAHTYNIQYNNVTVNGKYAVYLSTFGSSVINSLVRNNILKSNEFTGNRAVYIGNGYNNSIRNNTGDVFKNIFNENDLPHILKNHESVIPDIIVPIYYREDSNGKGLTKNEDNVKLPLSIGNTSSGNKLGKSSLNIFKNHGNNTGNYFHNYNLTIGGLLNSGGFSYSVYDEGNLDSNNKVFEINKTKNVVTKSAEYINLIFICIILLFIFIGYKLQKNKNE